VKSVARSGCRGAKRRRVWLAVTVVSVMPLVVVSVMPLVGASDGTPWPQWGGPSRNFHVEARDFATSWPAEGPRKLWQRALGPGYSAIVTDGQTLYTTFRDGSADAVIALEAATGKAKWETKYDAPFAETCSERLGPVPRAAPLIMGDRLITISAGGQMNSFTRQTGERQWTLDLRAAKPDAVRACGYSASPVAFEHTIITTAGGAGRGVVAVTATTGTIAWQSQDFENGYSSPILIDLDGEPEVIVFTYGEVSGLNPRTGALEWTYAHPSDQGVNVATPIWGNDHLLFLSSAYNGGSRVLRLARRAGKVTVEEVWANRRVRIHFGNAVRIGTRIYGSNGDFGSAPFAAIDVLTGETTWRDRQVTRSTLVGAGDKLVILDEDGALTLATPTDSGLTVHAKATVLTARAWTVPTLSGTTLYLRDNTQIVALNLGR
jgi:outer membrane protein assembly factor BamB